MSAPVPFESIRAVSFDAAGTLLHVHPSVGTVYAEVFHRHGMQHDPDLLEQGFRRAFRHISKNPAILDPQAREKGFWKMVVAATVEELQAEPYDLDAVFADAWETFAHANHWRVYPDVEDTLRFFNSRGTPLALLSNWDSRLHTILKELGLTRYFQAVLISSEVGAEKPDIGIFRAAETHLGCKPAEFLHIGDSRHHDIVGAHHAGWSALLVRHDEEPAGSGEINHLSDLPALFHQG